MEPTITTPDVHVHPLPKAAPWVPTALLVFCGCSTMLMAASWSNPWRLLVLDDHDLLLTVMAYVGLCAFDVALWLTLPRGWPRRLVVPAIATVLCLTGFLLAFAAPFAPGVGDITARIGSVDGGSVHTVHSSFIMSGCYQFEVRDESGWFTRHRPFGVCLDDEKEQPTASTAGSRLTVTVGERSCVYEVDVAAMRVHPVNPSCDLLEVVRPTT